MQVDLELLQQCWFLGGPTAVGKTATAIELAHRINAEIIALDSMTLYRGMDIGTAKPSTAERAATPHHMLDILEPWQDFSVADYLNAVSPLVAEILQRGKTPLFAGGTGLYLRCLLRGVFEGPPASLELREELKNLLAREGEAALHLRLQQVDPVTAARLHLNDIRRIIRALEVFHASGKPLSQQQQEGPLPEESRPPHVYWLSPPRDWLYDRINRRVEMMLEQGLLHEVHTLAQLPNGLGRTASQGLGYKEMLAHIHGECDLQTAVDTIKTRTRQFAKRQHTWYRNLVECREIPVTPHDSPETIVERILSNASAKTLLNGPGSPHI